MRIGKMLVILTILIIFINIVYAGDAEEISNLNNESYEINYINWTWKDPSSANFTKVMIYIDGKFKTNISKGKQYYNATGFSSGTSHSIGTLAVDTSGNISTWVNDTKKTKDNIIRFITIGDAHITSNVSNDAYQRLTNSVNYINNRTDVDFVVQLGDIADSATSNNFANGKSILDKLTKKYYVVEGNHDIGTSGTLFVSYFGPTEHIESVSGHQLIFVGINKNGTKNMYNTTIAYDWSFNYDNVDKNRPTIIFAHGPVQAKPGGSCRDWDANANNEIYFSYACNMKSETDKFTNLLGYYAGHVHKGTNQMIGNTLFVTGDNLGGNGADSDYIGYTIIKNGVVVGYWLLNYSLGPDVLPSITSTPVATATPIPIATATPIPIATATPIPIATATPIPIATATPIPIATTGSGGGNSGGSSSGGGNSGGSSSGGGNSGGSSSGGGSGGTAEPYENIYKYEIQEHAVFTTPVSFKYLTPELAIYDVLVTSMQNDIASLRIEVLKDTSRLVGTPAPGIVYKNINAWIDYKRIKNATIRFKVENSWMSNNGISDNNIKMLKWDNNSKEWIELMTNVLNKDDNYTYVESQTDSFSSFAIGYIKDENVSTNSSSPVNLAVDAREVEAENVPIDTENPKAPGFESILSIISILSIVHISKRIKR